MTHAPTLSCKRTIKLFGVFYNENSRRHFMTSISAFCRSPNTNTRNSEMLAAPPASTVSQLGHNSQYEYEPTLIANPSSATSRPPTNTSTTPSSFQTSPESTKSEAHIAERINDMGLAPFLHQVTPQTVNRVFYFDSLALSKKLESKGFTREQSEGCVECLLEVIGNTLEHQAKHMVTKSEQKIREQQLETEIMSVRKDMVMLQKSEFSAIRRETEKISIDIARLQSHFQDELVKLKGQFTLDVNLERGRAVEAHAASEKNLQMVDNKIETEIAHLKTTYEVYRNDIFKYAAGTVLTCTTLIIGFIRLWK